MIVDIHTHTPNHREPVPDEEREWSNVLRPDRPVSLSASWNDYERDMVPVDVSIVFNMALRAPLDDLVTSGDPSRVNDATAEFVAADRSRRIGFLSVNPSIPGWDDELQRCVADLGLVGIKLGPNYQAFDPLGKQARRLYGLAQKRGLPIVFHQGTSAVRHAPIRYAHPLLMDEVAMDYPELRIVMAHMGHPWQADTLVVIRKHPNVWADVSAGFYRPWSFYQSIRFATEWGVLGKLLFASDYPIATPAETIAGLRSVNDLIRGTSLPGVPPDEIEAVISRDALAVLGLSDPRLAHGLGRRA